MNSTAVVDSSPITDRAVLIRNRRISIVIPAYNESVRLPATLHKIDRFLKDSPYEAEILVVDDGSTDGTGDVAAKCALTIPSLKVLSYGGNRGKGCAVRAGILAATAPVVLFTDADLSTPIEELNNLWQRYEAGCDVVIASRYHPHSRERVIQPLKRMVAGRAFNLIIGLLTVRNFSDTQCGFKLFRTEYARRLFQPLKTKRFSFDVEILLRARRLGFRICEVPVRWTNSPDSRVRIVRDSLRMLIEVLRMRQRV